MKGIRFEMQPGGWLLLSAIYFFGDLEGLLLVLGNAAVHEWGHLAALRGCGVPIRRISFGLTGLCIYFHEGFLGRRQQFIVAAAGPLAGLAAACAASAAGNLSGSECLLAFAGGGAVLSGFNLLPARPLDGWRMLTAVSPGWAKMVSSFVSGAVLLAGLWLMCAGYGTALAFMGIVLLLQNGDW